MSPPSVHVTAAEISRLAGVTRATVSNWRRRHPDFPAPVAGSDASPLYDLAAVRAWLDSRGQTFATPNQELRSLLRLHSGTPAAARLLPLVLVAERSGRKRLTALMELPDEDLATAVTAEVATAVADLPVHEQGRYTPGDASLVRAVLGGVLSEGGAAVLNILAERELTDTHSSGAHSTPRALADLMARLVHAGGAAYPGEVFDPACGGGTLLEAASHLGATRLLGQDRLDVQVLRSAIRLRISLPGRRIEIRPGDSLRDDAFPELQADAVLCNPPFGDREWGHDDLVYDPRWTYGTPPRGESELAWVQHALAHLTPGGHAVLLLPPGTAFRSPGRRIRAELLRAGVLRAIIALPAGVVVPFHIGLHLWILRRPDAAPIADSILMIDLGGETATDEGWSSLTDTALTSWRSYLGDPAAFASTPGVARAVPLVELLGDAIDLNPARHLHRTRLDPAETERETRQVFDRLSAGLGALSTAMSTLTWASPGAQPKVWRTATVGDLGRGGLLTVLRAAPDVRADVDPDKPVILGRDVRTGNRATGVAGEQQGFAPVVVQAGDVLIPRIMNRDRATCRVADEHDSGVLLGRGVVALRPDPARLDPWFLAGFLLTDENLAAFSSLRQDVQVEPQRLKVPILPLREQAEYGAAFRNLFRLEQAAQQAAELAAKATRIVSSALAGGALVPPGL